MYMYYVLCVNSYILGWTLTPSPVHVEPCTEPVGPTIPVSQDPLKMFSHFFDDEVMNLIVQESNRYVSQVLDDSRKTWKTDLAEIKAYMGLWILMEINKKPEPRDY